MVTWEIKFTKTAEKHARHLKAAHLDKRAKEIIEGLKKDPFGNPPPYEKLRADLSGKYSRRINIKHRIVYEVCGDSNTVLIYGMFSHYGD